MSIQKKLTNISLLVIALVLTGGTAFLQSVSAASGSMYISPSSKSVDKGDSFTVNVRINPGSAVDTVHVEVNYETSKLQYLSSTYSGSPFSLQPSAPSSSGGTVTFDQAKLGGSVTSDSFIASVKFKALTGSGSSSLTLSGSNAANGGSTTGPSTGSATITLTTPTTDTGGSGGDTGGTGGTGGSSGGDSGGSSSGGSSSGGSSTKDKPAPKPTPVIVDDEKVQFTRASVVLTSKDPTKVYIKYGLDGKLTSVTKTSSFAKTHTVGLDPKTLIPGLEYSYVVVSTNKQGASVTSKKQTFKTKGLTITVGVFDKNRKPVANKEVELHSEVRKATTDANGVATFEDVTPGTHEVVYADGEEKYTSEVYVANNVKTVSGLQNAPVQNLSVVYGFEQPATLISSTMLIAGLGVLVVATLAIILIRRGGGGHGLQPVYGSSSTDSAITSSDASAQQDNSAEVNPVDKIPYPSNPAPGATISPQQKRDEE